jgi:hypothetical protein
MKHEANGVKNGAPKIIDTFETYHKARRSHLFFIVFIVVCLGGSLGPSSSSMLWAFVLDRRLLLQRRGLL